MANLKTRRLWNEAWKKLSVFFSPNGELESPFDLAPVVIDEPLTLYVETTGNDNGPGTADRPLKTIQAAIDYLNDKLVLSSVTIQAGIGSFAGFIINHNVLKFGAKPGTSESGSLIIKGTWTTPTLATGTASGTGTSAVVDSAVVITDGTQNWTANDLKGKFVLLGSTYYPIIANTATTFTIPASSGSFTSYTIVDHGTKIDNGTMTLIPGGAGTAVCRVGVYGNCQTASTSSVSIRSMRIESTGLSANQAVVSCRGIGSSINMEDVAVVKTSSISMTLVSITTGVAEMTASRCYFYHPDATGSSLSFSARNLILFNCYIRNGSIGFAMFTATQTLTSFFSCTFESCATGLFLAGALTAVLPTASCRFISCTTAVSMGSSTTCTFPVMFASNSTASFFFSGCTTCFQIARGTASIGICSGTGNTNGIVATYGARVQIPSSAALGASTELSVDGTTGTLVTLRGNSPKVFPLTPNAYGTYIYE